jgi:hypothetical protein
MARPDPLLPAPARLATQQQRTHQAANSAAALSQIGALCPMTISLWQRSQAAQVVEAQRELALQPALAPEAVSGEVVQRSAQVPLGVAAERAPVPDQSFQRGLQQVLAGLVTAGEQHRRAHQIVGALGEEALKLPDDPVICRPPASFACQARTSGPAGSPARGPDPRPPGGPVSGGRGPGSRGWNRVAPAAGRTACPARRWCPPGARFPGSPYLRGETGRGRGRGPPEVPGRRPAPRRLR